jgi:hypothetical protein
MCGISLNDSLAALNRPFYLFEFQQEKNPEKLAHGLRANVMGRTSTNAHLRKNEELVS